EVREAEVLDRLTALVEKSLVVSDSDAGRYRLLETVRQYAEERLKESGEREEIRRRHFDFYLAFAETAGAGLQGPEQAGCLRRIDGDTDNLLAAHAWCLRTDGGAESGYRLVHAIKLYW